MYNAIIIIFVVLPSVFLYVFRIRYTIIIFVSNFSFIKDFYLLVQAVCIIIKFLIIIMYIFFKYIMMINLFIFIFLFFFNFKYNNNFFLLKFYNFFLYIFKIFFRLSEIVFFYKFFLIY